MVFPRIITRRIVSFTFLGALLGATSHATAQTVGDAIPIEDPVYGDMGTVWLQRFGAHLDVPDVTADGAVTNADVIQWLRFEMWNIHLIRPINEIEGIDGDDVPPCQQAALALTDYLRLISGDVTLDNTVNEADVTLMLSVLSDIQQNPGLGGAYGIVIRYDVNQDDVVDQQDVIAVTQALGRDLGQDPISLAQAIVYGTPECGGGDPPPDPWEGNFRHPTHSPYFSSTYPWHLTGISQTIYPGGFPNDHVSTRSATWPLEPETNPGPAHGTNASQMFPPNHLYAMSGGWPTDPLQHAVATSREWPPNHAASNSATWYPDPTTIPPGTPTHDSDTSRGWDTNHRAAISSQPQTHDGEVTKLTNYSPHEAFFSSGWDHNHNQEDSAAKYPPNHYATDSSGWQPEPTHRFDVTLSWPAGHNGNLSSGWPQDGKDRGWPATHFRTYSDQLDREKQGVPRDILPPGILPPDHVWLTSVTDVLPFVPKKAPPPQPPGE